MLFMANSIAQQNKHFLQMQKMQEIFSIYSEGILAGSMSSAEAIFSSTSFRTERPFNIFRTVRVSMPNDNAA